MEQIASRSYWGGTRSGHGKYLVGHHHTPRLSSCEEFQTVKYLVKYASMNLRLNLKCKNDSKDVQAKIFQLCGDMYNVYMMLRLSPIIKYGVLKEQ